MIEQLFLTVRKAGGGKVVGGLETSNKLVSFDSSSSGFPHDQSLSLIRGSRNYSIWFN